VLWLQGRIGESKYGLTLEDPELEVLAHPGDTIDSLTIGRGCQFILTEGGNMVEEAVIAALPAAAKLKDPCQLPTEPVWVDRVIDAITTFTSLRQCCLQFARRRLVFDEFSTFS